MDPQNAALLKLFAAAGVGYAYQWFLFGPQKIKSWLAWCALGVTTLLMYWWANPSFLPDFGSNWRLAIVGIISFFLTAKGTGSTAAAAKIAPKSNTLAALVALGLLAGMVAPAMADPVLGLNAGFNAVTFDAQSGRLPSDYEAGGTASMSVSPHVALVGSAWYGLAQGYVRGSVGPRITATDVNDPNFSIGFGIQYQGSSDLVLRPQEWTPDVAVGWKPWPQKWPRVILGAGANYGLDSGQACAILAARYQLHTP